MPNANTFSRCQGANSPAQGVNAIPAFAPSGTSAAIVLNQAGTAATVTVGQGSYISGQTTSAVTGMNTINFDGVPFKVRVAGKVTTGASANITCAICLGSSTTYASGNVVATTGAVAVNTTSGTWWLEATMTWDSQLQKVQGLQWGAIANSAVSTAALTNSVAATTQSALVFSLAMTTSATTGCVITITDFCADVV